jgi:hypothetical protein
MPVRIQRQRTKGWRMPEGAVYVGRPSEWGNPWEIFYDRAARYYTVHLGDRIAGDFERSDSAHRCAVDMYRAYLDGAPLLRTLAAQKLAGHDLACWCPLLDKNGARVPCHADVLLEIAAGGEP